MTNRQEYRKSYYQAHKDKYKAYNESHKEERKAYMKLWHEEHKESETIKKKVYYDTNKDKFLDYQKVYRKVDVNSLGQSKHTIRQQSGRILKRMNLHIDGYEIHHCFGYEDANKFIYISKSLHLKIHKYLRDNNISADSNHWMQIRDIVNDTDEFTYIKC